MEVPAPGQCSSHPVIWRPAFRLDSPPIPLRRPVYPQALLACSALLGAGQAILANSAAALAAGRRDPLLCMSALTAQGRRLDLVRNCR